MQSPPSSPPSSPSPSPHARRVQPGARSVPQVPLEMEEAEYRPLNWRRRVTIGALAIATAVTIVLTLLYPPGGVKRHAPPPPPEPARCAVGQANDCVGGLASVIAPSPASAPK